MTTNGNNPEPNNTPMPPTPDNPDKSEFRCMYCNMTSLVYSPIITQLHPDEQYYMEAPYGEDIWIEEEVEEGYMCLTCGAHCSVEEVYWWFPGDPDPLEQDDN